VKKRGKKQKYQKGAMMHDRRLREGLRREKTQKRGGGKENQLRGAAASASTGSVASVE